MSQVIRCSGAHCHIRDTCNKHVLPTSNGERLYYTPHPIYDPVDCEHFEPKQIAWGEGADPHDAD